MNKKAIERVERGRTKHLRFGFQVTLSVDEKVKLTIAAERANKSVAAFIRDAALEAAK